MGSYSSVLARCGHAKADLVHYFANLVEELDFLFGIRLRALVELVEPVSWFRNLLAYECLDQALSRCRIELVTEPTTPIQVISNAPHMPQGRVSIPVLYCDIVDPFFCR